MRGSQIVDLHIGYNLGGNLLRDSQLYVDASNLFDKEPAFYNSTNGYDGYSGNVLGRVLSVGFRLKL